MKTALFILAIALVEVLAEKVFYNNYQVHRTIPKNEEQVQLMRNLEKEGFSFWSPVRGVGNPVDIMVAPHQRPAFEEIVQYNDLEASIHIKDVQDLIDNERAKTRSRKFGFDDYYRYEQIYEYLKELEAQYPNVKVIKGGQSYEGRDIVGVHITNSNQNKSVFLEGGIHAREWISPATVLYILTNLLTSTDPAIRQVADGHDWYIFPVFNPDGYEFTFTKNRLWRKTRQPYGSCHGADPNRNWGYHWMEGGSNNDSCFNMYAGPSAFSEPETKSMSEFITTLKDDLTTYISFHSFSQLLLIPYGHSSAHVENYDQLERIGYKAVDKLKQRYGTEYRVGNVVEVINVK